MLRRRAIKYEYGGGRDNYFFPFIRSWRDERDEESEKSYLVQGEGKIGKESTVDQLD